MRLTLRTLLAYMDGILEPEDAEDIRGQLDKSEYAQSLVHRIQEAVGRLRLTAPQLFSDAGGLDPNTVAEYLDNTLSGDRVPDFERACLESDVHLAEVASCHQILTLVLGEAAEIDPTARQRMYELPDAPPPKLTRPAPAAAAPTPVLAATVDTGDGDSLAADATEPRREKPTVPEYLREPDRKRRLLPIAAAVALAICFLVAVLFALGQFEPDRPLGRLLGFAGPVVNQEPGPGPAGPQPGEPVAPVGEPAVGPDEPSGVEGGVGTEPPVAPEPPDEPETEPGGAKLPPVEPIPDQPGQPLPDQPLPGGETPLAPMPPIAEPGGAEPGALPESPGESRPVEPGVAPGSDQVNVEPGEGTVEPPEEPEPPATPMGRFMSEEQILLRHEPAEGVWMRAAAKASLHTNERLLALPTFRPEIALSTGTTLQLLGGTRIELLPAGADQVAGVRVGFGRMLIQSLAQPSAQLRLVVGQQEGIITFDDPDAVVALAVEPMRIPGTDPEAVLPVTRTLLYVPSGTVTWSEANPDAKVEVAASTCLMVVGQSPRVPVKVDRFPAWVTSDTLSEVDRRASSTMLKEWQPNNSAEKTLVELTGNRRREVQWLAAGSMGYIGRFEPTVAPLAEPSYWESFRRYADSADYVGELRWALARGPKTAAAVREAFERQYPGDAAVLYRMLWGYTLDGLRGGEAAGLVDYLEHDALPVRGLAFWNLRDLTGWSLYYEPEDTPANRQQAVAKWRERLASGEILKQAVGRLELSAPPAAVTQPVAPAELPAPLEPLAPIEPVEPTPEPSPEPEVVPAEPSVDEPPGVPAPPQLGPVAPPVEP